MVVYQEDKYELRKEKKNTFSVIPFIKHFKKTKLNNTMFKDTNTSTH